MLHTEKLLGALLIFQPQGLSCRIDDTRAGKGGEQWTLSKPEAKAILESKAYHVNPGYKARSGTFTKGPRQNWLYTKALFPEPDYLKAVLKNYSKMPAVSRPITAIAFPLRLRLHYKAARATGVDAKERPSLDQRKVRFENASGHVMVTLDFLAHSDHSE